MNFLTHSGISPVFFIVAILLALACAIAGALVLMDEGVAKITPRRRTIPLLEREKDVASGMGWPWKRWLSLRLVAMVAGVGLGIWSRIPIMLIIGAGLGLFGVRFYFAGRAANRRLRMERAFLAQLRNLRDRMEISNQSLDTALQEVGRNPGKDLEWVMAPLARGGSIVENIVEVGERARSPVVESACGVLLWARTRSLESLIQAIDEILLPVGDAQLAVQEEAIVTLAQQRAVVFAMSFLMIGMFFITARVEVFHEYYSSFQGNVILALVILIFVVLVMWIGVITRVPGWTRWNLRQLAREQEKLGV